MVWLRRMNQNICSASIKFLFHLTTIITTVKGPEGSLGLRLQGHWPLLARLRNTIATISISNVTCFHGNKTVQQNHHRGLRTAPSRQSLTEVEGCSQGLKYRTIAELKCWFDWESRTRVLRSASDKACSRPAVCKWQSMFVIVICSPTDKLH